MKAFNAGKLLNPDKHTLSGSLVEGAMAARLFQRKEDWREIETDIMCNIFTIPQELSHLLEPVEDKIGFVRLRFSRELCFDVNNACTRAEKYLEDKKKEDYSSDQMTQYIDPLIIKGYYFNASIPNPALGQSTSQSETTVEDKLDWVLFRESVDKVPSVRLHFWPQQATTWITRCRLWPPQDTIQSIVDKGCQLVPRSSPGGDVHSEWRLSFSGPEAILAQLRTKGQQQAYYFFKAFFYQYLKCVESSEHKAKPLYSYIIKTAMLWASEELHPEDPVWASLEKSSLMLAFKLLESLEAGFLPHYFIPEINLLERVGEDVRNQCSTIISRWKSNILMTAPFDMPEKREFIHFVGPVYSETCEYVSSKGATSESDENFFRASLALKIFNFLSPK